MQLKISKKQLQALSEKLSQPTQYEYQGEDTAEWLFLVWKKELGDKIRI